MFTWDDDDDESGVTWLDEDVPTPRCLQRALKLGSHGPRDALLAVVGSQLQLPREAQWSMTWHVIDALCSPLEQALARGPYMLWEAQGEDIARAAMESLDLNVLEGAQVMSELGWAKGTVIKQVSCDPDDLALAIRERLIRALGNKTMMMMRRWDNRGLVRPPSSAA